MSDPIARLRAAVRDSGSPLAAVLGDDPAGDAGSGSDVELAVTAVHEGYLLHYGRPRALEIDDPDLALLAGDRLYALGLARLADAGDLARIGELADVIALSAQAHAAGDAGLAQTAWDALGRDATS